MTRIRHAGSIGSRSLKRFAALALAGLLCGIAPAAADDSPFRVVFIAYENPNQLLEDAGPVVAYLEAELGRSVRAFVATDYAGIVEALKNGSADMGFMGALQYVVAHREANAEVILGEVYDGRAWYQSHLFARRDAGFEEPADLEGKSIAFVDPISSSGYLYPLQIFIEAGVVEDRDAADAFFGDVYFAGGDEQAMRAVLNGFVDAAGIGEFAYELLRPDERDQIVKIGESPRIPSHCVVVRAGLDRELVGRAKRALLSLAGGPNEALLATLYGVDGYVEVDHAAFAEVEELAESSGFLRPAGAR